MTTLMRLGVNTAFGVPGGTISSVYTALTRVKGIRHIATRHECAATFAALGHARATGRPALVFTTSGPGITNTLTGLASAAYEGLPVILVGGEVPRRAHGRGAIQDGSSAGLGIEAMLGPICRWTGSLEVGNAAGIAAKAWSASMGPTPGPVLIRVPLDIGGADAQTLELLPSAPSLGTASPEACRRASKLLRDAKRPLLVLGNGARGAHAEILELAERLRLPTVVTGHGKGAFPEDHPLYVGIIGLGQHPSVVDQLTEAPDVTLVIGSRLNDLATNGWTLPLSGSAATIQIDRDSTLVGANAQVTLPLIGDAKATLATMLDDLPAARVVSERRIYQRRSCKPSAELEREGPIKPQALLCELQRQLPDARFVSDIGEHLAHALHTLRVDRPEAFTTMLGYGSMGSGVCSAIGIKLAVPDEPVVCICGDGGFSSYMAELMTCVENRVAVIFVVFNDGVWNMVEHGFEAVYGARPVPLIETIADLGAIARRMGARGHTIHTLDELRELDLAGLADGETPVVIDARIDASESLTRETRSASLKHFHGGLDHGDL